VRCCADFWRSERCSRKPPWRARTPTVAAIASWGRPTEARRESDLIVVRRAKLGAPPEDSQEGQVLMGGPEPCGKDRRLTVG
jgi:hypothetical protein